MVDYSDRGTWSTSRPVPVSSNPFQEMKSAIASFRGHPTTVLRLVQPTVESRGSYRVGMRPSASGSLWPGRVLVPATTGTPEPTVRNGRRLHREKRSHSNPLAEESGVVNWTRRAEAHRLTSQWSEKRQHCPSICQFFCFERRSLSLDKRRIFISSFDPSFNIGVWKVRCGANRSGDV